MESDEVRTKIGIFIITQKFSLDTTVANFQLTHSRTDFDNPPPARTSVTVSQLI